MKHNLGKICIFLFVSVFLRAEDFSYTFSINKQNPYVKEAIILTLDINQTNHEKVLIFNFNLKESNDYSFQRLDTKETDIYHDTKAHYVYLVYPLRSGDINIGFDLLKKVTSDERLQYSFSGDRDNIKNLTTINTNIILPPLQLKVKALPSDTLLVGNFSIIRDLKKHEAQAFEPLPLQITITGEGYPPLLDAILPKDMNVTRFAEKPIINTVTSTEGIQNTVTYPMALSHHESFTLPSVSIKAFNPKTEKSYILSLPSQDFDITEITKETLVDKIDSPEASTTDWSWLKTFLNYLFVFASGYLSAFFIKTKKKSISNKNSPLKDKIQNCQDERALLQLLMSVDNKCFKSSIETLEASLYGNGKINFKNVKEEAKELA